MKIRKIVFIVGLIYLPSSICSSAYASSPANYHSQNIKFDVDKPITHLDKLNADKGNDLNQQNKNEALISPKNNSRTVLAKKDKIEIILAPKNDLGISHNRYHHFSVPKEGIVLNNIKEKANYIINEVIKRDNGKASIIEGNIHVLGRKAHVIIANPNGISCESCSFTNTISETLVSGKISSINEKQINYNISLNVGEQFSWGKLTFTDLHENNTEHSFNNLNIISNNLKINMVIKSKKNINIYNGIDLASYQLQDKTFKTSNVIVDPYDPALNQLMQKTAIKASIKISNEKMGTINNSVFNAKKINIYAHNSKLNNYSNIEHINNTDTLSGHIRLDNYGNIKNSPKSLKGK